MLFSSVYFSVLHCGYYNVYLEQTLEHFIVDQGCSIHDFYHAMEKVNETDPDGSFALFGQILVSVTDFHVFMTMMRESARSHQNHK